MHLRDRFGNPVISEKDTSGKDIKTMSVGFNFSNTTELDQLDGAAGDSSIKLVTGADLSGKTFPSKIDDKKTTTGLLTASGASGDYSINIYSYAPTSTGYKPIENDGFAISLKEVNYSVSNDTCSG